MKIRHSLFRQSKDDRAYNLQLLNPNEFKGNMNNEKRMILAIAMYAAAMTMILHTVVA